MKKYLASVVVLGTAVFLVATSNAQVAGQSAATTTQIGVKQKGNRVNSSKVLMSVLEELKATPEQTAKVKDILKSNMKDMVEIHKQMKAGTITKEDAKEKQKALHKTTMDSIKAVLNADQAKQFEPAMKAAMKKAREEAKEVKSGSTPPPAK